jgi:hypothetical protein
METKQEMLAALRMVAGRMKETAEKARSMTSKPNVIIREEMHHYWQSIEMEATKLFLQTLSQIRAIERELRGEHPSTAAAKPVKGVDQIHIIDTIPWGFNGPPLHESVASPLPPKPGQSRGVKTILDEWDEESKRDLVQDTGRPERPWPLPHLPLFNPMVLHTPQSEAELLRDLFRYGGRVSHSGSGGTMDIRPNYPKPVEPNVDGQRSFDVVNKTLGLTGLGLSTGLPDVSKAAVPSARERTDVYRTGRTVDGQRELVEFSGKPNELSVRIFMDGATPDVSEAATPDIPKSVPERLSDTQMLDFMDRHNVDHATGTPLTWRLQSNGRHGLPMALSVEQGAGGITSIRQAIERFMPCLQFYGASDTQLLDLLDGRNKTFVGGEPCLWEFYAHCSMGRPSAVMFVQKRKASADKPPFTRHKTLRDCIQAAAAFLKERSAVPAVPDRASTPVPSDKDILDFMEQHNVSFPGGHRLGWVIKDNGHRKEHAAIILEQVDGGFSSLRGAITDAMISAGLTRKQGIPADSKMLDFLDAANKTFVERMPLVWIYDAHGLTGDHGAVTWRQAKQIYSPSGPVYGWAPEIRNAVRDAMAAVIPSQQKPSQSEVLPSDTEVLNFLNAHNASAPLACDMSWNYTVVREKKSVRFSQSVLTPDSAHWPDIRVVLRLAMCDAGLISLNAPLTDTQMLDFLDDYNHDADNGLPLQWNAEVYGNSRRVLLKQMLSRKEEPRLGIRQIVWQAMYTLNRHAQGAP